MGDMVEVFGDLQPGDVVAKVATDELQEGVRVVPVVVKSET